MAMVPIVGLDGVTPVRVSWPLPPWRTPSFDNTSRVTVPSSSLSPGSSKATLKMSLFTVRKPTVTVTCAVPVPPRPSFTE